MGLTIHNNGLMAATDTTSKPASSPATSGTDAMANEQTFLKLFVAQIQNQNPLNPTDGIEFVSQLAQFSQLEQSIQMRTDLDVLKNNSVPAAAGTSDSGTGGTGKTGGN